MSKWNAELYDQKHQFVSKYGENLVTILAPKKGETILDVGCGTGDLANQIAQSGADVTGVDFAHSMIEEAQRKYPSITFDVQDASNLPYTELFDAVFSNAALHWIKTPERAVNSIYQVLKNGGRFVGEMGGFGNIQSIVDAVQQTTANLQLEYRKEQFPWYFPTVQVYTQLLQATGFHVDHIELYERPTKLDGEDGMMNWLKMFSDSLFVHLTNEQKHEVYEETQKILRATCYHNGEWTADYCRLRFIAHK